MFNNKATYWYNCLYIRESRTHMGYKYTYYTRHPQKRGGSEEKVEEKGEGRKERD